MNTHPPSHASFWSVVDDRTIGGASLNNQSGQIPNPSDVSYDQSAMSQQQAQLFLHSNGQDGLQARFPLRPLPASAFIYYSTEQDDVRTVSAGRSHYGGQIGSLQAQHAFNFMFGEPGASSQSLGISHDFPTDSLANLNQFNPRDILDTPFDNMQPNRDDTLQLNPRDIVEPPFNDMQTSPNFGSIQFNPSDILDTPFNGAQFNTSDNTSRISPPTIHIEPCAGLSA